MTGLLSLLASGLILACAFPAQAQTGSTSPSAAMQQVLGLAPQLALFAGSPANMQALAEGLVLGQPIVLSGVGPDGRVQTVTISASPAMPPTLAAQALERARQSLVGLGIPRPTPQQIGIALVGGTLATPAGISRVTGAVSGSVNPGAVSVQSLAPGLFRDAVTPANQQSIAAGLTTGSPVTLTGLTSGGTPTSLTFTVPGGAMTAGEAALSTQQAIELLASQGIVRPTPDQLRAALLGGSVVAPSGQSVALRGVLEGRGSTQTAISRFGTSASPSVDTSASPAVNTSASPIVGTSNSPSPAASGASAGAPSIAVQLQNRR